MTELEPATTSAENLESIELSLDDAVLALNPRDSVGLCVSCSTRITVPGGYKVEVSGSADEVQRVALALLQHTSAAHSSVEVVHGNKYVIEGSAGAVGDGAASTVINTWNHFADTADMHELAHQLAWLRSRLDPTNLDQASLLGSLANAESAIRSGDGASVLAWLRKAGRRGLEIAQEVGTTLVTEALKAAMGIGH